MTATEAAAKSNVLCALRYDGEAQQLWLFSLLAQQLFVHRGEDLYEKLDAAIADNYLDWQPGQGSPGDACYRAEGDAEC